MNTVMAHCGCNEHGWPAHPEIHWYRDASPGSFELKGRWAKCDEVDRILTALKYRTTLCGAEVNLEMCEQMWCDEQLDKKSF